MRVLTERLQREIARRGHDAVIVHWDDSTPGDLDRGRPIKTLRDVFGAPQYFLPRGQAERLTKADAEVAHDTAA